MAATGRHYQIPIDNWTSLSPRGGRGGWKTRGANVQRRAEPGHSPPSNFRPKFKAGRCRLLLLPSLSPTRCNRNAMAFRRVIDAALHPLQPNRPFSLPSPHPCEISTPRLIWSHTFAHLGRYTRFVDQNLNNAVRGEGRGVVIKRHRFPVTSMLSWWWRKVDGFFFFFFYQSCQLLVQV